MNFNFGWIKCIISMNFIWWNTVCRSVAHSPFNKLNGLSISCLPCPIPFADAYFIQFLASFLLVHSIKFIFEKIKYKANADLPASTAVYCKKKERQINCNFGVDFLCSLNRSKREKTVLFSWAYRTGGIEIVRRLVAAILQQQRWNDIYWSWYINLQVATVAIVIVVVIKNRNALVNYLLQP